MFGYQLKLVFAVSFLLGVTVSIKLLGVDDWGESARVLSR